MSIVCLDSSTGFIGEVQKPFDYAVSFKEPLVLKPNSRVQLLAVKCQSELESYDVSATANNNIFYYRLGLSEDKAEVFNNDINPALAVTLTTGVYNLKELCAEIERAFSVSLERSWGSFVNVQVTNSIIADNKRVIEITFVPNEIPEVDENVTPQASRIIKSSADTDAQNVWNAQGRVSYPQNINQIAIGDSNQTASGGIVSPVTTYSAYLSCPDMRQDAINGAVIPYNVDTKTNTLPIEFDLRVQSFDGGVLGDLTITLVSPGAAANIILWDAYAGSGFGSYLDVKFGDQTTLPTASSFAAADPTSGEAIRPNDGLTTFDATLGGVQANGSWELVVDNLGGGNWNINTGILILPHASHQSTIATGPLYKTTPISIWNGQLRATDTAMLPFNINSTLYSQGESFLNGTENFISVAPVANDVINHCGYWWGLKGKSQMVTDNISIVPSGATFDNFATEVVQWDGSIDIPSGLDLASSNRQTMDVGCYVALGGEIIGDGYVAQKGQVFACFFDKDLGRLVYCWCNKVAAGRRGKADTQPITGAGTFGDLFQSSFNSGAYPQKLEDYRLALRGNNSGSEWTIESHIINATGDIDNIVILHSFSENQTEVFADNVGAGINPFVITPAYYPLNEILTPASGDCPIIFRRRGRYINTGDLDADLNTQAYPNVMVQDIAPVVSVSGNRPGENTFIQPAPFYFLKVGKISSAPEDVAPDAGLDDANAPASANFGKMIGFINRGKNSTGDADASRGVLASGRPQANTTWAVDLYNDSPVSIWNNTPTTDGNWNVNGYFQGKQETDTLLSGNTNLTYIRIPELPISMKGVKNSSDYQAGDDTIVGAGFPLGHGTIIDNTGALTTPTSYYQPTQSSHQFIGNAGEMRLTQLSVQFVNGEGQLRTDLIGESYVALHFIGEETAVAGGQILPNENAV